MAEVTPVLSGLLNPNYAIQKYTITIREQQIIYTCFVINKSR